MFIYLLFLLFINNINNINALNEKFCVNCRYFISPGPFCDDKYGRCRLYPKKPELSNELNYLVSGKRKLEYRFCNFVRQEVESCGKTGKYYNEKVFFLPGKKFLQSKLLKKKNDLIQNDLIQKDELINDIEIVKDNLLNE